MVFILIILHCFDEAQDGIGQFKKRGKYNWKRGHLQS